MNKKKIILMLIFSFCSGSIGAFNYGTNAKEVALAGTMVSIQNKGFNSFANPSFISNIEKPEWGISYFTMSLDRSIQAFSYSMPVPPAGGISLSFLRVGINDIRITDNNNNQLDMYNHWEGYGMMSFALKFTKISLGANLKLFLNQLKKTDLSEYPAKGLGLDIGMNYIINERLKLGSNIQNLGANYKWGEVSNKTKEEIPVFSKFGILFKYSENLNILTQFDFNDNGYDRFRIGTEYLLNKIQRPLYLRAGFKESNNNEISFLYYLGFGITFKMNNNKLMYIDYALDPGAMGEGLSHIFSFSI